MMQYIRARADFGRVRFHSVLSLLEFAPMTKEPQSRYLVKSLVHASKVLFCFRSEGEVLRLRDLASRTGFNKMTCYRLAFTLHQCGFLEKVGEHQYRRVMSVRPNRQYRIGYGAAGENSPFFSEVEASLLEAANGAPVEVMIVKNRFDSRTALRNADTLVRERVDLAIEFQTDEAIAPLIAGKFLEAGIPLIAIDIPHPGATYFGANNYQAGLMAGYHLAQWANQHWEGAVDEVLLIELGRSGSLPQTRIQGMLAAIGERISRKDGYRVSRLDGGGEFGRTQERVRMHLRTSKAKRLLVGAATDRTALGALRAFEEAGRAADCAVVGQNADPEGRAELRNPRSRLIGSVAFFPERYGAKLIRLAIDILAGRPTPPAVFTKHQLVTHANIDHVYPNDTLMGFAQSAGESKMAR
ncbi:MAG TPA: substrate-binding domain-containing protein [Bryobacteraceae bacterium]|nr:substrate-binding domain-containing protein [Bryobacteraceae bacterium]